MNSYNFVFTKRMGVQAGKTLRDIFVASGLVLLNADQGNFIRKAVFCVKGGEVLAAQSVAGQNTSCFANEGEAIKLADNSTSALNPPIYFELDCGPLAGSQAAMLDLRTSLKFTSTVNVDVILFF
jgi:hypothetical protein